MPTRDPRPAQIAVELLLEQRSGFGVQPQRLVLLTGELLETSERSELAALIALTPTPSAAAIGGNPFPPARQSSPTRA